MHAVIRTYTGPEVIDLIVENQDEVQGLIEGVEGFVSYTAVRTADGAVTVTVCQDKAGCDESVQKAREWIAGQPGDYTPPVITEGPVEIDL